MVGVAFLCREYSKTIEDNVAARKAADDALGVAMEWIAECNLSEGKTMSEPRSGHDCFECGEPCDCDAYTTEECFTCDECCYESDEEELDEDLQQVR